MHTAVRAAAFVRAAALLVTVLVAAPSVAAGVVFQDLSVGKALAQAESEGKPVLLYYTTTWCAPCRVMEATTLEEPDVAAWVAEHTVAVKVDGDLSVGRAKRYDERQYPAVVYVDPDGSAVDRIVGLIDGPGFLAFGENVLSGNYGTAPPLKPRAAQSRPRLTLRRSPKFPKKAISRGIREGSAVVSFTVTATGAVRDAKVIESEPPSIFDRAAINAVTRSRFEPALEDGAPIEVRDMRIRISFKGRRGRL